MIDFSMIRPRYPEITILMPKIWRQCYRHLIRKMFENGPTNSFESSLMEKSRTLLMLFRHCLKS